MDHGDVQCGHCAWYAEKGCGPAEHRLSARGWPRARVLVRSDACARKCPGFAVRADIAEDERGWREQRLRERRAG